MLPGVRRRPAFRAAVVALVWSALLTPTRAPALPVEPYLAPRPTENWPEQAGIPATCWAGPKYARGRLRVLVLGVESTAFACDRLPYELARAGDFELESGRVAAAGRRLEPDRTRNLLQQRWDVVLLLNVRDWECAYERYLPRDVQVRLEALARAGAGLVFVDRPPARLVRAESRLPIAADQLLGGLSLTGRFSRDLAHWKSVQKLKAVPPESRLRQEYLGVFRLGRGRVVRFERRFILEPRWGEARVAAGWEWEQRLDVQYAIAELVRVILIAADRAPEVLVTGEPAVPWEVPWRQAGEGLQVGWRFRLPPVLDSVRVHWRLRDLRDDETAQGDAVLGATATPEVTVRLPPLDAGRYYLDVFLDSDRGRETYAYAALTVPEQLQVRFLGFPESVNEGEPMAGQVSIEGPSWPDAVAVTRLLDNHGRVLQQQPFAWRETPGDVEFPVDATCSVQSRVEVLVEANGRRLARASHLFRVLRRGQGSFGVVTWEAPRGEFGPWARAMLWRCGITASTGIGTSAQPDLGAAALLPVPVTMGPGFSGEVEGVSFVGSRAEPDPGTGIMQPCCWNDTGRLQDYLSPLRAVFDEGASAPTFLYCLFENGPIRGCCQCPACLAACRTWLREHYADDLAGLNREWGTQAASWDEVGPLEPLAVCEPQAREHQAYARWLDRYQFGFANFARTILARQRALARRYDPAARLGVSGSGSLSMDVDALLANSDFWCPDDDLQLRLARSRQREGYLLGRCLDANTDLDQALATAWGAVLDGATLLWWRRGPDAAASGAWLGADLRPTPAAQRLAGELALPLRRGLGDLLGRFIQDRGQVGVYITPHAVLAGEVSAVPAFGSVEATHRAVASLLDDCGYAWRYLTKSDLVSADGLQPGGIRLLVLAQHLALGQAEVDALAAFVRQGGTVLADVRPGVLSGHGRILDPAPAARLFGISRTGLGRAVLTQGQARITLGDRELALAVASGQADAEVEPGPDATAARLGDTPVLITRSHGRGHTVLLNLGLGSYAAQREAGGGEAVRAFLRALAGDCGVTPSIALSCADGTELSRCRTAVWRDGGVTVYGVLRGAGTPTSAVRVTLPGENEVFSLRRGALGRRSGYELPELRPGTPEFLAVYPYDPGQPEAIASPETPAPGGLVTVHIRLTGVPATETAWFGFTVRLLDPRGMPLEVIPWCALGRGGRASVPVRFAWNDVPGEWRLEAREITTGRAAVACIRLGAAPAPRP